MAETLIELGKETVKSFNQFVSTVLFLREHKSASLPRFTSPYLIESPLFIQRKVFMETDLLNDVISSAYDLYAGYVLLAVKLDSFIDGGRRIRDILSTVSTSSYVTSLPKGLAGEQYHECSDIISNFSNFNINNNNNIKQQTIAIESERESKYVQSDESRRLISGRLIEISVNIEPDDDDIVKTKKDNRSRVARIPLYIKFNPRVFPDSIVDDIISANINPTLRQRWLQFRAGEISFFKDFLMQIDLAQKRAKALKKDKSGVLYDMLYHRHKGLIRRFLKLIGINSRAQNIFNSIFIFDRYDLKRASNNAGINFDRYSDRQKFFQRNLAMFVYSVDNNYNITDIYIDSIKQKGEYTFNQMKKMSKGDGIDIIEVIKALQQQQVSMRVI